MCVCVGGFQNQLLTRGLSDVLDQVLVHSGESVGVTMQKKAEKASKNKNPWGRGGFVVLVLQ